MRKRTVAALAGVTAAAFLLAACGSSSSGGANASSSGGGNKAYVGVILPDSASSARWETDDRPYLEAGLQGGRRRVRHPERPG